MQHIKEKWYKIWDTRKKWSCIEEIVATDRNWKLIWIKNNFI